MQNATRLKKAIGHRIVVNSDVGPVRMTVLDARSRFGTIDILAHADGIAPHWAKWIDIRRIDRTHDENHATLARMMD